MSKYKTADFIVKYFLKYSRMIQVIMVFLSFMMITVSVLNINFFDEIENRETLWNGALLCIIAYTSILIMNLIERYVFRINLEVAISLSSKMMKLAKKLDNFENQQNNMAVSISYLIDLKKRNNKIKIQLLSFGLLFAISHYYFSLDLLLFSILCLCILILIIIKEYLIEFRIKKGWFGTNKDEVKTLIKFLVKNSENIDFTDDDGHLKEVFFPESSHKKHESSNVDGVRV